MASERKYYWLKFQHDFFSNKTIKKLRGLAGGDTFTIIYLKMMLKSLATEGILEYTGIEATFAEEIALDIDEGSENVGVTVNYLLSCGLMEMVDENHIQFPYVLENTTSETGWAEKKRSYRKRIAEDKNRTLGGHCPTDIDIEIEKEIESESDTEIEKENREENIPPAAKREKKTAYGIYRNVKLTQTEYAKLVEKLGDTKTEKCIEFLDSSIEEKGYKYKSHYLTIAKEGSWVQERVDEMMKKQAPPQEEEKPRLDPYGRVIEKGWAGRKI